MGRIAILHPLKAMLMVLWAGTMAQPGRADTGAVPTVPELIKMHDDDVAKANGLYTFHLVLSMKAFDAKAKAALPAIMARGDVDEAARVDALCALVKARSERSALEDTAGTDPVLVPKNLAVRNALREFDAAARKAQGTYEADIIAASKAHVERLDEATKAAMKASDLESAKAMAAAHKSAELELKRGPGRFPPDAVVILTFDKATVIKSPRPAFADLSGNDNHAIVQGPVFDSRWGRVEGAVDLTAKDSLLRTEKKIEIAGSAPRTLAFWVVFPQKPAGNGKHMAGWGEGPQGRNFYATVRSGQYSLWASGYGNDWIIPNSMLPVVGRWTHIAVTYDGSTARWYCDGVAVPSTFRFRYNTVPTSLTCGGIGCLLDELVVYNRVLNDAEMRQLRSRPALPN